MGRNPEPCRHLGNIDPMAHPAHGLWRYPLKQLAGRIYIHLRVSILADNRFLDNAVQQVTHQLGSVADSKNRYPQFKNLLGTTRRSVFKYHIRSACENDSLGIHLLNLVQAHIVRMDFAVYIALADAARNQLIILTAKVQNDNHLSIHEISSSMSCLFWIFPPKPKIRTTSPYTMTQFTRKYLYPHKLKEIVQNSTISFLSFV